MLKKLNNTKMLTWLTWMTVAAGVFARLKEYLDNRSLWYDEAVVANQLINIPFMNMITMEGRNLGYPAGFVGIQKILIYLFGHHEYVLRLFPLICGVAALVLLPLVLRKFSAPVVVWLTTCLFAFSPELIYYAAEVKPYATDVLATICVLMYFNYIALVRSCPRVLAEMILVALVVCLFSLRGFWVMGAGAIGLSLYYGVKGDRSKAGMYAVLSVISLILMAVVYVMFLRPYVTATGQEDWNAAYMFPPQEVIHWAGWVATDFIRHLFKNLYYPIFPAFCLFVAGVVAVARRRGDLVVVMLMPVVLVLILSLSGYPLVSRLLLFIFPILLCLIAEGFALLWLRFRHIYIRGFLVVFLVLMCSFSFHVAYYHVREPITHEALKPIMAKLSIEVRPDDAVYVYYGAWPAWSYYEERYGFKGVTPISGIYARGDRSALELDMARMARHQRVWIVLSHDAQEEAQWIHSWMDAHDRSAQRSFTTSSHLFSSAFLGTARAVLYE